MIKTTPKSEIVMPKRIVPLADTIIRTTKPADKPFKLFDGGGLFLLVTPTGGKLWNLKYRFVKARKIESPLARIRRYRLRKQDNNETRPRHC